MKQDRGWAYVADDLREHGRSKNFKTEVVPKEKIFTTFRSYLRKLANVRTCHSVYGGVTNCNCLHYLRELNHMVLGSIVRALLNYHELPAYSRKFYQMDRLQYSQVLSGVHGPLNK